MELSDLEGEDPVGKRAVGMVCMTECPSLGPGYDLILLCIIDALGRLLLEGVYTSRNIINNMLTYSLR